MNDLVFSNIRQRPVRTLISVAGVALGVSLVMLFTGLARGMSEDAQRRASNWRAEILFTRPGAMQLTSSTMNLSTKYVELLKKLDGVADAVPVARDYSGGKGRFGFTQIEGVSWQDYATMNAIKLVEGRAPQANDEIIIDEAKVDEDNVRVGDTLSLYGNKAYRIVGIFAPASGARIKMSLEAMQDALGAPNKCTFILVKCQNADDAVNIAKHIDQELPGNKIQFTRELVVDAEKRFPALKIFLRTLVVLAALVSALIIMLSMYTTITERTREIGILKSLGASRATIVGVIEREAFLIGIIGLVVGIAFSFVAGFVIQQKFRLVFEYSLSWTLAACAIALLGSLFGALYPAMRAARLDPVAALSYE
ncbi:MAG: ABC transporter permease [Pyrinomonadaceae bacterium]